MSTVESCPQNSFINEKSKEPILVEVDEADAEAHLAAFEGQLEKLEEIIQRNPDVLEYKIMPFRATVLRMAVTGGSLDCVRLLLKHGADIECIDAKAQTPLFIATCSKNAAILKELLEAGASPEASPKNRSTPMLIAVRDGFAEGIKILTQYKARTEPNKSAITYGVNGWALHHSVVYAHFNCFLALIQAGGCVELPEAKDLDLQTAARLSIPHAVLKYCPNHFEFLQLFYECGGHLWTTEIDNLQIKNRTEETANCLNKLYELRKNPLSLRSICRLNLRNTVKKKELGDLFSTDLPGTLVSFLNFGEYEKHAKLTETNMHIRIRDSFV